MIAMAICTNPDVLIADEPTTALDVTTQARIMEMLDRIVDERRMGVILITHDLGLASSFCDDIHVMYAGRIVESGSAAAVLSTPAHPYSEALLDSICGLDRTSTGPSPRSRASRRCRTSFPRAARSTHAASTPRRSARVQPPPADRRPGAGGGVPLPGPGSGRVSATDATAARTEPVPDGEPLVVVDHLSRHFRLGGPRSRRVVRAVDDVSLVLNRGETFGLVGESGSGKSTLARLLLRLDEPTSGSVHFESTDLFASLVPRAAPAAPRDADRLPGSVRVAEQAEDGRADRLVPAHRPRPLALAEEARSAVTELLELVGLRPEHASAYPRQLSGGQCQRVSIARALALNPKLVVLDEAVSAVDVSIQAQILNLLRGLQDRLDLTYLFVTHDLAVVRYMADTIAVMYLGRIVEQAPRDSLFAEPQHPYTHALLASIPPAPGEVQREQIVLREAPASDTLPSGCRFHPRCPLGGREVCRTVDPPLHATAAGHTVACHFPQSARSLLAEAARAPP